MRYPVWQHTFVSPSAFSRRAVVSYWQKYVHEVLVNRLGDLSLPRKSVVRLTDCPGMTLDVYWQKYVHEVLVNRLGDLSLPRKRVVRLTDRPDMTLDVYRGRKTTIQQQQQPPHILISCLEVMVIDSEFLF